MTKTSMKIRGRVIDLGSLFGTDGTSLFAVYERTNMGQIGTSVNSLAWMPNSKTCFGLGSAGNLVSFAYDQPDATTDIAAQNLMDLGNSYVGLAYANGKLWTVGIDYANAKATLFQVDADTGNVTKVGDLGPWTLLQSFCGNDMGLYAADAEYRFFSVDPATGAATQLNDPVPASAVYSGTWESMAISPDSGIFCGFTADNYVWSIDPTSGKRISPPLLNSQPNWLAGMTFAQMA